MNIITLQEFQSNFDYYISKVEQGEHYKIKSEYGTALLVLSEYGVRLEDEYHYLTDHNDGC